MIPSPQRALLPACMALLLAACSPVARRPEAAATPWWEAPASPAATDSAATPATDVDGGQSSEQGLVLLARAGEDSLVATMPDSGVTAMQRQAAAARPTVDTLVTQADSSLGDTVVDDTIAASAPQIVAARRLARAQRGREDRERVFEVNEYALWCVEQGLWQEARIHLEQAMERDSLAASLHNNLAIVYEREGRGHDARQHYTLAVELDPERELYQANLKRLRQALKHRPPRADSLADSAVLLPPPRGEYRPDEAGGSSRAEGDSQP